MAAIIFAVAAFTDAIDGGIARSRSQITELGIILDPIADKLLISSGFIALSIIEKVPAEMRIPAWAVIPVITRDIIIVIGALLIYLLKGDIKIKPSWLGKITTFWQMIAILSILTMSRYGNVFMYPAVFFTILSGLDYIWRGSKQLNETQKT
jgi:CDP-diacylglycerol--glycerol-3-phosphate 3-phosphatidyltransferase